LSKSRRNPDKGGPAGKGKKLQEISPGGSSEHPLKIFRGERKTGTKLQSQDHGTPRTNFKKRNDFLKTELFSAVSKSRGGKNKKRHAESEKTGENGKPRGPAVMNKH